jgi:hypothetical protein
MQKALLPTHDQGLVLIRVGLVIRCPTLFPFTDGSLTLEKTISRHFAYLVKVYMFVV